MDSTIQIKNNLISRIKNSNDLNFIRAIQTIFDTAEQELFQLNDAQNKSIDISRAEINKGDYTDNKQVISDIRQWLKKK